MLLRVGRATVITGGYFFVLLAEQSQETSRTSSAFQDAATSLTWIRFLRRLLVLAETQKRKNLTPGPVKRVFGADTAGGY